MKHAILALSFAAVAVGCGKKDDSPGTPPPPQPKPKTACELTRERYEAMKLRPEEKVTILKLEKQRGRVVRQDCHGNVKSDGIEDIVAPRRKTQLRPDTRLNWPAAAVELFNAENCETASQSLPLWDIPLFGQMFRVTGDKDGAIDVKFDASPAVFTFQLADGLNKIYYSYYQNCRPSPESTSQPTSSAPSPTTSQASQCADPGEVRSGLYLIHMTYAESMSAETLTIKDQTCPEEKKPSAP